MKTSENVAKVSAQLIRAAVNELWNVTTPDHRAPNAREKRKNALASLSEVANQLEQYSPGDPS